MVLSNICSLFSVRRSGDVSKEGIERLSKDLNIGYQHAEDILNNNM